MPIQLSSIPAHIRVNIIEKIDLVDIVNFSQVSRKGLDAVQNVKTKYAIENLNKENKSVFFTSADVQSLHLSNYISDELKLVVNKNSSRSGGEAACTPVQNVRGKYASDAFYSYSTVPVEISLKFENKELKLEFDHAPVVKPRFKKISETFFDELPVRLDACNIQIWDNFTEEFCQALIRFLHRSRTSINYIDFTKVSCSPGSLGELIEAGRIDKMVCSHFLSSDFMKVKAIENKAIFILNEFMEESEVLALKALKCTVVSSNFSNDGAHEFIKEVLAGERNIFKFSINTTRNLETDFIFKGIPILGRISHGHGRESVYVENGCIFCVTIDDGYFSICEW